MKDLTDIIQPSKRSKVIRVKDSVVLLVCRLINHNIMTTDRWTGEVNNINYVVINEWETFGPDIHVEVSDYYC